MLSIPRDLLRTASRARALLSDDAVESVARSLADCQRQDGGFCGRSKRSDLYFTLFGVGTARALGIRCHRRGLRSFLIPLGDGAELDLVHLSCLVQSRAATRFPWLARRNLRRNIERFRLPCGAYARTVGGPAGGPYASYMALLAHQAVAASPPDFARTQAYVHDCCGADGSFSDGMGASCGTVPATAAAVAVLTPGSGAASWDSAGTVAWLIGQFAQASGGMRAVPDAPAPDLLATAVGLYALQLLGVADEAPLEDCLGFVESLWCGAGFGAIPGDQRSDCEYTFYGLLALGVIATALGVGDRP